MRVTKGSSAATNLLLFALLASHATRGNARDLNIQKLEREAAFIGYSEKAAGKVANVQKIVMTTNLGKIRITPRADISPKLVDKVVELASRKEECKSCIFYRNEPVPDGWGQKGYYGPPYALLQGSLIDMLGGNPEAEGKPPIKKGDVCHIGGSKEFFIAKGGHEEWTGAFTVWGHIEEEDKESWDTVFAVPVEPFTEMTGDFTTRWLTAEAKVPFQLSLE